MVIIQVELAKFKVENLEKYHMKMKRCIFILHLLDILSSVF